MTITLSLLACLGMYVLIQVVQMLIRGRKYRAHSYRLLSEGFIPRMMLPLKTDIPWVAYGAGYQIKTKYTKFQRAGMDAYVQVSATAPHVEFFLADAQAIKDVSFARTRFLRDNGPVRPALEHFGPNLILAEGDEWKRIRKINQKAFTEKNLEHVRSETAIVMNNLFEIWDQDSGGEVRMSHTTDITRKLGLMIISAAGFGRRLSWNKDTEVISDGYQMSFETALDIVSLSFITKAIVPTWAEALNESWRRVGVAHKEVKMYLRAMMAGYQTRVKTKSETTRAEDQPLASTNGLFNMLLTANAAEAPVDSLTNEAVIGSTLLYLVAGLDTTSHALAYSLGLLALYPEVQDGVYARIKYVLGSRGIPSYSDLSELKLVTGVLLESLRLYPVFPVITKIAQEDTILNVAKNGSGTNEQGRETIFVPAGAAVITYMYGIHYNPRYWPKPEQFRPSRFTEEYNRDAFLGFSTGHRSCIGRRFAEVEVTVALTMILARYKISVDAQLFETVPGECALAREARLLESYQPSKMAPKRVPLSLERRY